MELFKMHDEFEKYQRNVKRNKDINVVDLLDWRDKETISRLIDAKLEKEYGKDAKNIQWLFTCNGYFKIYEPTS